ncbi:MAG: AAA family ATPase, partial [Actinomycetia bacterium]|nr:AAA family ATPase [Actinomycetes bacterium]
MTTTDTAAAASIEAAARTLKLSTVRTQATELAADAERSGVTYLGFLADLLEAEVDARSERRR